MIQRLAGKACNSQMGTAGTAGRWVIFPDWEHVMTAYITKTLFCNQSPELNLVA